MKTELCQEIYQAVERGRSKQVTSIVKKALAEGVPALEILHEGLLSSMKSIGDKYKAGEMIVPQVIVSTQAVNAGFIVLEPELVVIGQKSVGKVVIGTVEGDVHDIGKNLVAMMLRGYGFEIFDLGVDVEAERFVQKAEETGADIICLSALLTTTMNHMSEVIEALNVQGVREKYSVLIGGGPVNSLFAKTIGADYYTPDAISAAGMADQIMKDKAPAKHKKRL